MVLTNNNGNSSKGQSAIYKYGIVPMTLCDGYKRTIVKQIVIASIIASIVGLVLALAYYGNNNILQQDTISRWGFTIVCKRGTNECFCSYRRNPNDAEPTIGPCPFTTLTKQ